MGREAAGDRAVGAVIDIRSFTRAYGKSVEQSIADDGIDAGRVRGGT